jgi:hypothetical protein
MASSFVTCVQLRAVLLTHQTQLVQCGSLFRPLGVAAVGCWQRSAAAFNESFYLRSTSRITTHLTHRLCERPKWMQQIEMWPYERRRVPQVTWDAFASCSLRCEDKLVTDAWCKGFCNKKALQGVQGGATNRTISYAVARHILKTSGNYMYHVF